MKEAPTGFSLRILNSRKCRADRIFGLSRFKKTETDRFCEQWSLFEETGTDRFSSKGVHIRGTPVAFVKGQMVGYAVQARDPRAFYPAAIRSFRFFELPLWADTETCTVERSCFLSDHIKRPYTEDRGKSRVHAPRGGLRILHQSQLASTQLTLGTAWCKTGHVAHKFRNLRSTPSGDRGGCTERRTYNVRGGHF